MNTFPDNIKFKFSWRDYQERFLSELESHLDDGHLHVVAPPGSGKTILGLEVAKRLNKPVLILTPSIAIRNQWINRFCEYFIQTTTIPDWISNSIYSPAFVTVITYQALHASCMGIVEVEEYIEEEQEEIVYKRRVNKKSIAETIQRLKEVNLGTIVVDEAHHLKNEWWKSLISVKEAVNPTVVGLTATPPYDVTLGEWNRYIELNGPVDAEISVPELIKEGDLAPHQDYVFLSLPELREQNVIHDFREKSNQAYNEILKNEELAKKLLSHPVFVDPQTHQSWIYSNVEYYASIIIYLANMGYEISPDKIGILGDETARVPSIDKNWVEILLRFYLFASIVGFYDKDQHETQEKQREGLAKMLRKAGILQQTSISFKYNKKIDLALSSSISKLDSIKTIVNHEFNNLKQKLRMVILTDYIRKEVFNYPTNAKIDKIGVVPIFEMLRREQVKELKIGVLTGSLIILPRQTIGRLNKLLAQSELGDIKESQLLQDETFVIVEPDTKQKGIIVNVITQLFQEGEVEVLIGTKSLLGEGWDAPEINSLILASFVGSYVLSNQMRGRAIRKSKTDSDKVGNVWHLVSVDPTDYDGGHDIELIKQRFKAFLGVSYKANSIENGIARLDFPLDVTSEETQQEFNNKMLQLSAERQNVKQTWLKALDKGTMMVEEIQLPFEPDEVIIKRSNKRSKILSWATGAKRKKKKNYKKVKQFYFRTTISSFVVQIGASVTYFFEGTFEYALRNIKTVFKMGPANFLQAILIIFMVLFGGRFYWALRMFIKYRDIAKDIEAIADALLITLCETGVFSTEYEKTSITTTVNDDGEVSCHLEGATRFERSIFTGSLHEIVKLIDNPRYIIVRKSKAMGVLKQQDYHAVPEVLSQNKKTAEVFKSNWEEMVGDCELLYTRGVEGRKVLVKSRYKSLAAAFTVETKLSSVWR